VLIDTSASRETERIDVPSHSSERIWARLATAFVLSSHHIAASVRAAIRQALSSTSLKPGEAVRSSGMSRRVGYRFTERPDTKRESTTN
jgi:hypothetical protein